MPQTRNDISHCIKKSSGLELADFQTSPHAKNQDQYLGRYKIWSIKSIQKMTSSTTHPKQMRLIKQECNICMSITYMIYRLLNVQNVIKNIQNMALRATLTPQCMDVCIGINHHPRLQPAIHAMGEGGLSIPKKPDALHPMRPLSPNIP